MFKLANSLQDLATDIRLSLRRLRRSPVFAVTTVATFALGIAANSAIFSVMEGLVLRPLAVPQLNRVVSVAEQRGTEFYSQPVSLADFRDFAEQNHTLSELTAQDQESMTLTLSGQSEHIQASRCIPNLFALYRIQPLLGRLFAAGEDQPGRDGEVILTHALWQSRFGSNAGVLGRDLVLNGRAYTVIGVMPQSFDHVGDAEAYLPLAPTAAQWSDRTLRSYTLVGRLKGGVSVARDMAELNGIAANLARQFPRTNGGWGVRVRPLVETINGDLTPMFLRLVLAATLLLMVVVCANVSNLQFAYTLRRTPELAMRFALGSTRGRLLRELLLDSLLQSLLGAAGGVALAAVALHFMLAEMPARIGNMLAGWNTIHLDAPTLAYSILVALTAGLIAGLLPAIAGARIELLEQLKSGSRSVSGSRGTHRLRNLLSGAQIALATALVAGAVCIAASMYTMLHATEQFTPQQALILNVSFSPERYKTAAQQSTLLSDSVARLGALPGVQSATFTTSLPYNSNGLWWQDLQIPDDPALPGQVRSTQRLTVSPEYFRSFGLHLVRGRVFDGTDTLDHPLVAVISRRLARDYFGARDPVGRQIQLGKEPDLTPPATIVGIVDDVIYTWVDQVSKPAVYFAAAQMPIASGIYVLRTGGDPLALGSAVRRALDNSVTLDPAETYAAYLRESLIGLWYVTWMLAADALIALFLSGIGLFGVMANLVEERTQEIGIRLAVGAGRPSILLLLMRRSVVITALGLVAGLGLGFAVGQVLTGILSDVRSLQPAILGASALLVLLLSLLAGYLPARRATGVDPVEALRAQ